MDRWARLHLVAAGQYGVFSLQQAQEAGILPSTLRGHVLRGRCERLYPCVFIITGAPSSPERAIAAALMACGR